MGKIDDVGVGPNLRSRTPLEDVQKWTRVMLSKTDVQALFSALFLATANSGASVARGSAVGVELVEETLTQNFLVDVGIQLPQVHIATFTRWQESRETGADWEWWWEGEREWFGALVQAKRLSASVPGVAGLGYDFGYRPRATAGRPNPDRQIDLLIAAAEARELPPIYALYNTPGPTHRAQMCGPMSVIEPAMFVTTVHASVAHWLLSLSAHDEATTSQYTRPIACLACPVECRPWRFPDFAPLRDALGFSADVSEGDVAFTAASALFTGLSQMRMGQFRAQPDILLAGTEALRTGVRESPPGYVLRSLQGEPIGVDDDDGPSPRHLVVVRRSSEER